MDTRYQPSAFESKIQDLWKCIHTAHIAKDAPLFTIMMPPPNITGNLHIGHALNHTIQDVLIRHYRIKGYNTFWQPGLDHASISTQLAVEKHLSSTGINRQEIGRDAFIKRVYEWKEEYGTKILNQLKRLGISCCFDDTVFTMDESYKKAVMEAFIRMYNDGLIYKDTKLVNWNIAMQTAVSDLEVKHQEVNGCLYTLRYTSDDGDICIATTRPETIFADSAIAVNPADERYKHMIGKCFKIPLTNRMIPVITDEQVAIEFGSGALKITPAHDFTDYEIGKKHNLSMITIMDEYGCMSSEFVPKEILGMDRLEARKIVCAMLEQGGFIMDQENIMQSIPFCQGIIIEPRLTKQWFLDTKGLAQKAIEVVQSGEIKFHSHESLYFDWMKKIEPWCISRQLWWGQQIPVWYDDKGNIVVVAEHVDDDSLVRDTDVLDTWFSSALWAFATQGWPDKKVMDRYPSSILVSGFDIIFFWIARMIMFGMYFMKSVPFNEVYLHQLVRDEKGQKMSKTKGNGIDPIEIVDEYGADALRLTLMMLNTPSRDIRLSKQYVEANRNFITKLWNVARFIKLNCDLESQSEITLHFNKWIMYKVRKCFEQVNQAMEDRDIQAATLLLFKITKDTFCNDYIELVKGLMQSAYKNEISYTCLWVLRKLLLMWHPIIPFVTEEINRSIGFNDVLATTHIVMDTCIECGNEETDFVLCIVNELRSLKKYIKSSLGIKFNVIGSVYMSALNISVIEKLAKATFDHNAFGFRIVIGKTELIMQSDIDQSLIDRHIRTEIELAVKEKEKIQNRLNNKEFLEKASSDIVQDHNMRNKELSEIINKLQSLC